jgi:hypothetical protein
MSATGLFQWVQPGCGSGGSGPVGFELLQGNYGLNNFTSGRALWLQPSILVSICQGPVWLPPDGYTFEPLSDAAGFFGGRSIFPVVVSGTWSTFWLGSGPWGGMTAFAGDCPGAPPLNSPSACPLTSKPFAPGVYTVVAGDEWGQVALLHFTVTTDWPYQRG